MSISNFNQFYDDLVQAGMKKWVLKFKETIEIMFAKPNGNRDQWSKTFSKFPSVKSTHINLNCGTLEFGNENEIDAQTSNTITKLLMDLHPWRKGPYKVFDTFINSEWHSDWKWDRLIKHITPLQGRKVIDIGCGNGYHLWKMIAEKASLVIGVDPCFLFMAQFLALKQYTDITHAHFLPLGIEHLPQKMKVFDTLFSMGVLYHRKSPFEFLQSLKMLLKPGGELVFETLVIEGDENTILVPKDRYANMRNVWFIPSVIALEAWLTRAGFVDIKVIDISVTSTDEQRKTEWMRNTSLSDCLDQNDPSKTIEGYPAPKRAILVAKA